jgi:hypothetical protein
MHYGHASWIAVVVFGGTIAIRYLSSQRRRGAGRSPGTRSSFTGPEPRDAHMGPVAEGRGTRTPSSGTAPGWFKDPYFKHEQRYWSGSDWTEHVTDHGAPSIDPPRRSPGESGTA